MFIRGIPKEMVVADEVDIVGSGRVDLILSPEVLLGILQTLQS